VIFFHRRSTQVEIDWCQTWAE